MTRDYRGRRVVSDRRGGTWIIALLFAIWATCRRMDERRDGWDRRRRVAQEYGQCEVSPRTNDGKEAR